MSVVNILDTDNVYDVFYSDPPWKQSKGNLRRCRPNQGKSLDYQTCSLDEIKDIHRQALIHGAGKHNVFM